MSEFIATLAVALIVAGIFTYRILAALKRAQSERDADRVRQLAAFDRARDDYHNITPPPQP